MGINSPGSNQNLRAEKWGPSFWPTKKGSNNQRHVIHVDSSWFPHVTGGFVSGKITGWWLTYPSEKKIWVGMITFPISINIYIIYEKKPCSSHHQSDKTSPTQWIQGTCTSGLRLVMCWELQETPGEIHGWKQKTRVITPINMSFVFFWASQASNQSLWTSTMSMATYLASIWGDSNKDLRGQEMSYLMCRNIPKPQETADSSDSAPCCPFLARKKWWFPILHGLNMYQNAILIPGRSSP